MIMKTFSKISLALVAILFLLSFGMKSEAVAQPCTTILDTINLGGCPYEVELCIYCGAAYPGYVDVRSIRQLTGCVPSVTNYDELVKTAYKKAMASLWYDHCQQNVPPCSGTDRKEMTVKMYICWKAKLDYAPLIDKNLYYFYPCNTDEYCEVEYSYCIDSLGALQYTIGTATANFPSDSTLSCFGSEAEEVPLPVYPAPNGTESACFILHTPCNLDEFNWDD
jgi:hypothetical protein